MLFPNRCAKSPASDFLRPYQELKSNKKTPPGVGGHRGASSDEPSLGVHLWFQLGFNQSLGSEVTDLPLSGQPLDPGDNYNIFRDEILSNLRKQETGPLKDGPQYK